jgi:hypothetical protein
MNGQALKSRIQAIAKEKNIQFNVCWRQLLLERFLMRLANSSYASKFIFKGGFLLAYRASCKTPSVGPPRAFY